MNYLFVMDPIERINVFEDTTFAMMLAAQKRGRGVYYCRIEDLSLDAAEVRARVRPARVRRKEGDHVTLGTPELRPLGDFQVVCMRKDPPVDIAYVHATYLLEMAPPTTFVTNRPDSLRACNEKLYAQRFPGAALPALVSHSVHDLLAFCEEAGGHAVAKPVDGRGGEGVFRLSSDDANRRVILETLTGSGRRPVLVQRFLPDVHTTGDKRVIVVRGEPVGAVRRLPSKGDFRSNVHVGGGVSQVDVDDRDREICAIIGGDLRRRGILFAGLDVIGGYLTEINITSPTLVQEIAVLTGVHLEETILDAIEDERTTTSCDRG